MDIRVGAYAVVVEEQGILLAHWSAYGESGWSLPGGGLDPGEAPQDAVVREVREETGYDAEVDALLGIDSLVIPADERLSAGTGALQSLRIIYRAHVVGGRLRDETNGSTDRAAWVPLRDVDALDRIELVDVARRLAGLVPAGQA